MICSVKLSIYFSLGFNKDNQWTDVGLRQPLEVCLSACCEFVPKISES